MKIKKLEYIETEKGVIVAKFPFNSKINKIDYKEIFAEIHLSKTHNDFYISTNSPIFIDRRFESVEDAKGYIQEKFNEFITNCIES